MPRLSASQYIYLKKLNTKYRAFVGGFGSGKTYVGCVDTLTFFGENPSTIRQKNIQGYFGPSYPSIRDIFYPTIDECAYNMGMTCDIKEVNKEVHVYSGRKYYGTVKCRSMDKPSSIIGFKISRGIVDELDVLDAKKAEQAWNKIVARLRLSIPGVENSIGVTTTPEGYKLVYKKFADNPSPSYSMVQASTYENAAYLPEDYISSLIETYPDNLIEAYLRGQFVNLTSGSVYKEFDRSYNHSDEDIKDGEPLYIGMDFNVGNMTAVVHVKRDGLPVAVDEITGSLDTPEMIKLIKSRYWQESSANEFVKTRTILIYPDSSGDNRTSQKASRTDILLLKEAGFRCCYKKKNPSVKDRVATVNRMFRNGLGERRYRINTSKCPVTTQDFEQQCYTDNGEPDKASGNDHRPDAAGYFIAFEYPIVKPKSRPRYV